VAREVEVIGYRFISPVTCISTVFQESNLKRSSSLTNILLFAGTTCYKINNIVREAVKCNLDTEGFVVGEAGEETGLVSVIYRKNAFAMYLVCTGSALATWNKSLGGRSEG
jgi:hypothetical protein